MGIPPKKIPRSRTVKEQVWCSRRAAGERTAKAALAGGSTAAGGKQFVLRLLRGDNNQSQEK